jgi:hypothetical protein
MDLYLDKQYLKECENKLNYYTVINNTSHSTTDLTGLVVTGIASNNYIAIKTGNTLVIYSKPGFDISNVHVKKNDVFCYETRISTTAKKFILDVE